MSKYEHRVFRVKVPWDGGDYYLGAKIRKSDEWLNVDHLGEKGWEFMAFVPNHETYIDDSFSKSELEFIRLAVFKRKMQEGEEMNFKEDRAY